MDPKKRIAAGHRPLLNNKIRLLNDYRRTGGEVTITKEFLYACRVKGVRSSVQTPHSCFHVGIRVGLEVLTAVGMKR
jgi:hypothetical protein